MNYKQKVIARLKEQQEEVEDKLLECSLARGYDYHIEGIYLCGSQNYNTHHEGSDVDSKLVIVPTVRSMLLGKKLVHEFTLDNGEKCSVKSVMDFVDLFWKGNINNLEILTTEYKVVKNNSFIERLIKNEYDHYIPKYVEGTLWDASVGMLIQKQRSLFKGTETTRPYVEKYKFDGKDLTHIYRISDMLWRMKNGESFKEALDFSKSDSFKHVVAIRNGEFTKEDAELVANTLIACVKVLQTGCNPKNRADIGDLKDEMREWWADYYEETYL